MSSIAHDSCAYSGLTAADIYIMINATTNFTTFQTSLSSYYRVRL